MNRQELIKELNVIPSEKLLNQMEKTIYQQAIEKFGINSQVDKLIEESAELIQALLKDRRSRNFKTFDNVHEEFVDLEITMAQIKLLLYEPTLDDWRKVKHDNLQTLINES